MKPTGKLVGFCVLLGFAGVKMIGGSGKKQALLAYLESLGPEQLARTVEEARGCCELDRCFAQCEDATCDFHNFVLLFRTPCDNLRAEIAAWLVTRSEAEIQGMLDKPGLCPMQSFCMCFCAASCQLSRLFHYLEMTNKGNFYLQGPAA